MISRYFSSLKSFSHATSTSLLSVPLHRYIVKYLPSLISSPHNPHFFTSSHSVLYSTLCRFKTCQNQKNNQLFVVPCQLITNSKKTMPSSCNYLQLTLMPTCLLILPHATIKTPNDICIFFKANATTMKTLWT